MPGLFLLTPGTRASLTSERVMLEIPADPSEDRPPETREILLRDVEQVITTPHVHLTMPLLAEFMLREIPVIMAAGGGRIIGLCLPAPPHSAARLAQYRRTGDGPFALALAVNWVEAKIVNQRRVLQRLAANRPQADVSGVLAALDELAGKCRGCESLETLRGYEGTAAGRYFEAWGGFFPPEAPFVRRSRRPPLNPPNAVLSFAYSVMAAEIECLIHAAGLDPALGFYHEPQDRRASLALDLLEQFRAPVADALALDLFSHQVLKPRDHFEETNGGVYLNTAGRKRFFVAYERRMTREYRSEQNGLRTTLRAEFQQQVQAVKKAILDNEPFAPFLMN
jgi:CRISPR-associated protein Cas1